MTRHTEYAKKIARDTAPHLPLAAACVGKYTAARMDTARAALADAVVDTARRDTIYIVVRAAAREYAAAARMDAMRHTPYEPPVCRRAAAEPRRTASGGKSRPRTAAEKALAESYKAHSDTITPRTLTHLEKLSLAAARRAVKTAYTKSGDDDMRRLATELARYAADAIDSSAAHSRAADLVQAAALAVIEYIGGGDGLHYEIAAAATLAALARREYREDIAPYYRGVWYTALKAVRRTITAAKSTHGRATITVTEKRPEMPTTIISQNGEKRIFDPKKDVIIRSKAAFPVELVSISSPSPDAPDSFLPDEEARAAADIADDVSAAYFFRAALDALDSDTAAAVRAMVSGYTATQIAAAQGVAISTITRRLAKARAALAAYYRKAGYTIAD